MSVCQAINIEVDNVVDIKHKVNNVMQNITATIHFYAQDHVEVIRSSEDEEKQADSEQSDGDPGHLYGSHSTQAHLSVVLDNLQYDGH